MPDSTVPYIHHEPGDLITAEDWNNLQTDVRQDMAAQIASSIAGVKDVDHAKNADKLGDMTLADITKHILDLAFAQIPKRTGYMQIFLQLKVGDIKKVAHNLKAFPVTDVYQLMRFKAVCAADDTPGDARPDEPLFYLYHGPTERRIYLDRNTPVDIEPDDQPKFRILWKNLLDQLVEAKLMDAYDDSTNIDVLEANFWTALFASPPNDDFGPDAHCHSPWFEKCCGEKRSVGDIKGELKSNIFLKIQPVKTVNWDPEPAAIANPPGGGSFSSTSSSSSGGSSHGAGVWPANVAVAQSDLDTVALSLLAPSPYPPDFPDDGKGGPVLNADNRGSSTTGHDTLPIMLLLKV